MAVSRVTMKGQITLPAAIRKRFGLNSGQQVMFEATPEGILVKPVRIEDLTRTNQWQKKLQTALKEAQTGRGTVYGSGQEFLDALAHDFPELQRQSRRK